VTDLLFRLIHANRDSIGVPSDDESFGDVLFTVWFVDGHRFITFGTVYFWHGVPPYSGEILKTI
jgi:hypothetical protein